MVGNSVPVEPKGTVDHLLWNALDLLPREEQIQILTDGLVYSRRSKDTKKFLSALERLMHEDYASFRRHLREVYQEHALRDGFMEHIPVIKVRVAILRHMLEGWTWDYHHKACSEDAEECFYFLVRIYRRAMGMEDPTGYNLDSELIEEINGLFAQHMHQHGRWPPNELDSWIAREDVPEGLSLVLTKARARILAGERAQREAQFRSELDAYNNTSGALNLIIERARVVQEVDQKLRDWGSEIGKLPGVEEIQFNLESLTDAVAIVTIQGQQGRKGTRGQLVSEIKEHRDAFEKESDIHIRLTIKGPGDFSLEE